MAIQSLSNIQVTIASIRRMPAKELHAHERRQEVTRTIIEDLKKHGVFFRTTEGYFYFEKSQAPKLLPIEDDSVELAALIQERYGINRAERCEYEHILSGLRNEAHVRGRKVEIHKLAHYDTNGGRLYVSRFDGWVYRLDGNRIQLVSNGTDDVFFLDHRTWQPYELVVGKVEGQPFEHLILASANFGYHGNLTSADQRWLFSVWCFSQFFGSLHPTKPLLLVCGEKGGGKTLSLRKWLKFLFGQGVDVTALERSKPDGFVAAVCSSPIAVFDNVDEQVSWLPDHLAQLATGVSFKRRKYYTTNQEVEFQPRCFVALTSRTPKFIEGRDDVLDRTLVLQTERRKQFDPEEAQLRRVSSNRNLLWTELLRNLNKIVEALKEREGEIMDIRFRMADFAAFAIRAARSDGQEAMARKILEKMEARRADLLLAKEPIAICLAEWLVDPKNQGRAVTGGDLYSELGQIAKFNDFAWPYQSAQALGQRLYHILTNLREQFDVRVAQDRHAKQHRYSFWRKGESSQEAPNPAIVAGQEDTTGVAGNAGYFEA
jgi:hypothetical protein